MATYLGTHGSKIQNYTTDPDNPNTGEVWYNDTANTLKFQYINTGSAWSTGGNLNTARNDMANVLGASVLGLCAGGSPTTGATEEWNTSSDVIKTLTD